jgi:lysophospholipase L1-like esterase
MKISHPAIRLLFAISLLTGIGALEANASLTLTYALPTYVVSTAAPTVTPTVGYESVGVATTFSVAAGALPIGLNLNANDGSISGTPTSAGTYNFTIMAQNGTQSASASVSATVIATSTRLSRSMLAMGNQARLQRLIAKGRAGTTVTIAAIGGSITQGSLATTTSNRYANLVQSWWETAFPSSSCTLVNAGVGATCSDYGALRAQRDALSKNPDLVIVEFAVNDGSSGLDTYGDAFEGLLRQLLNAPSKPAVIVLFMTGCTYNGGEVWQSTIAGHYDLPMVSYEDAVKPELTAGTIVCSDISPDGTHPNDAGHALVAQLLENMISASITAFPVGSTAASIPATPVAQRTSAFEFVTMQDGADLTPTANSGWTATAATSSLPAGLASATIGSTLDFEVTGNRILVSWLMDNDGNYGKAKFTVDNSKISKTLDGNFYNGWGDYREMAVIGGSNLNSGTHTIHVELLSAKDTTSTGNNFRVLCVGTADSNAVAAPDWADTDISTTGWFSSWCGAFYYAASYGDWVYNNVHGWQYVWPTSTSASTYIWDDATQSWLWTDEAWYPALYSYATNSWLYYDGGITPNRVFWDYGAKGYIGEAGL